MSVSQPRVMTPQNITKYPGLVVRSTRESVNDGLCIALYSGGGVAKTTTAAMLAMSKHVKRGLVFDIEAGTSSIAHLGDRVDASPITSFKQIQDTRRMIARTPVEQLDHNLFILDNMTELMHMRINELAGGGQPQIQHWGTLTADFLGEVRAWRDLARSTGIHVVFCVWEEREKDEEQGRFTRRVFFTPKLAQAFPGIVTMVGHILPVRNKNDYRRIMFAPTESTDSKFRVAPTEEAANIPQDIYYKADQPVLADILDTIRGDQKWPANKYTKPAVQAG